MEFFNNRHCIYNTIFFKYTTNDLALFLVKTIFISGILALVAAIIRKLLSKSEKSFFHFFSSSFFYISVIFAVVEPIYFLSVRTIVLGTPFPASKEYSKEDSTSELISTLPLAISTMNESHPKQIDSLTELTKAIYRPSDTTVIYCYRITEYSKNEMIDIDEVEANLKPIVTDSFFKNSELLRMNRHHVNVVFRYSDKENVFLFDILFKAEK